MHKSVNLVISEESAILDLKFYNTGSLNTLVRIRNSFFAHLDSLSVMWIVDKLVNEASRAELPAAPVLPDLLPNRP